MGRELAKTEQSMERCLGDLVDEQKLTGAWIAHQLISSKKLLHNLLIGTVRRPRQIEK